MSIPKTILVTGATGKQGRATIDALLASISTSTSKSTTPLTILALTRNMSSPSAASLARKLPNNVQLLQGDLDDSPGIFAAAAQATLHPVWGVFGVTTPMGGGEERQGKGLVDAAIAAGVRRFVFSPVERGAGEEKSFATPTNVPHFITKHNIEHHLREQAEKHGGEMSWTILRPVAFMDNFTPDLPGKLFSTAWKQSLGAHAPLQLISCADIGVVAAQAFLSPEAYTNRALSLASDEITYAQAEQIFRDKVGTDIPTTYGFLARAGLWAMKDLGLMFRWFREEGFGADVEGLRREHAGLLRFGEWLEKEGAFVKR